MGCLLCEWMWIFSVRLCRCRVLEETVTAGMVSLCLASSVTHCEAGLNVVHWCPHGMHAGEIHRFNTSCLSTKLNLILVGV